MKHHFRKDIIRTIYSGEIHISLFTHLFQKYKDHYIIQSDFLNITPYSILLYKSCIKPKKCEVNLKFQKTFHLSVILLRNVDLSAPTSNGIFSSISILNHSHFEEWGHISKMTGYSSQLLALFTPFFAALKIHFASRIIFIMWRFILQHDLFNKLNIVSVS